MIEQYNANQNDEEFTELIKVDVKRFADVDNSTKMATLNTMRLDQLINEQLNNEVYNNIKLIRAAWEKQYEVELQRSELQLETMTTIKRKSKQQQFKEDYEALLAFKQERDGKSLIWSIEGSIEQGIKQSNPLAYQAIQLLKPEEVRNLKYKISEVQQEVILKMNVQAEVKLLKLLDQYFKCGTFYTNEYIKTTLQKLYKKLNIRNKDGKQKVAYPLHLGDDGRFDIEEGKKQNKQGKWVHGYTILRKQFKLMVAA